MQLLQPALVRAATALTAALLQAALVMAAGCTAPPEPVAVVRLAVDRVRVPLGASVETTIQFDVAPAASALNEDYRVVLDVLDDAANLLWSDEHYPPLPTSTWKPGQSIQYRRRLRIPAYPYLGPAVIAIGLQSPVSRERVMLAGDDVGEFAYRVATLTLEPQHESSSILHEDGWHQTEFDAFGRNVWRWTTGRAVFSFRNPRAAVRLMLDLQGSPGRFERPQQLSIVVDERTVREAMLDTNATVHLDYDLTAADLGDDDVVRVELLVDQTFIPADRDGSSQDTRELGIRVFDAYVELLP